MNPLTSGQSWLDLLHAIVNFPLALVSFVLTTVFWAVPLA
ncbi:sensor domain-containing protein [Nonomuraea ferruginea]